MPDHWELTTLGEAAEVEMGQSPPGDTYNSHGDGLPFLQGSAEFGGRFPSPDRWCSAPTRVAEPGDLLVSVRAPVGDTNFADTRLAIGRGLARVRTTPVASADFLRLVIQAEVGRLNKSAGGGMFASITAKNLRGFRVALPPVREQRRIVDIVKSVDSYIDCLQTQVEATSAARSAVLAELLSKPGDDWQEATLGEVAEITVGPAFKSSVYRNCDDGVPLLRGINIGAGGLRWDEKLYWPHDDTTPYEKYLLAANQTVVAMDATFTAQGDIRAALVNESDLPLLLNQRVAAIAAGPSALSEYVFLLIGSDEFRRFLGRRQTGAYAPHIARRDLVDFPVWLPPMSEQGRVAELIGSLDAQVAALDLQVEAVRGVRAAVLSELLTGERLLYESYDALVSL